MMSIEESVKLFQGVHSSAECTGRNCLRSKLSVRWSKPKPSTSSELLSSTGHSLPRRRSAIASARALRRMSPCYGPESCAALSSTRSTPRKCLLRSASPLAYRIRARLGRLQCNPGPLADDPALTLGEGSEQAQQERIGIGAQLDRHEHLM